MTVHVRVDRDACQGHALCFGVDPDLFPLDDLGYSAVVDHTTDQVDAVRRAAALCPERAITHTD